MRLYRVIKFRVAFEFILNIKQDVTTNIIGGLHSIITSGELDASERGVVRKDGILITGTDYTPAIGQEYLLAELHHIVSISKGIFNSFQKAIYLHLSIAYLQAFKDGNKRTARMVQTAILVRWGIVPLLFNDKNITHYRESLFTYYETGSSVAYVEWFVEQYRMMYAKLLPDENIPRKMKGF